MAIKFLFLTWVLFLELSVGAAWQKNAYTFGVCLWGLTGAMMQTIVGFRQENDLVFFTSKTEAEAIYVV